MEVDDDDDDEEEEEEKEKKKEVGWKDSGGAGSGYGDREEGGLRGLMCSGEETV